MSRLKISPSKPTTIGVAPAGAIARRQAAAPQRQQLNAQRKDTAALQASGLPQRKLDRYQAEVATGKARLTNVDDNRHRLPDNPLARKLLPLPPVSFLTDELPFEKGLVPQAAPLSYPMRPRRVSLREIRLQAEAEAALRAARGTVFKRLRALGMRTLRRLVGKKPADGSVAVQSGRAGGSGGAPREAVCTVVRTMAPAPVPAQPQRTALNQGKALDRAPAQGQGQDPARNQDQPETQTAIQAIFVKAESTVSDETKAPVPVQATDLAKVQAQPEFEDEGDTPDRSSPSRPTNTGRTAATPSTRLRNTGTVEAAATGALPRDAPEAGTPARSAPPRTSEAPQFKSESNTHSAKDAEPAFPTSHGGVPEGTSHVPPRSEPARGAAAAGTVPTQPATSNKRPSEIPEIFQQQGFRDGLLTNYPGAIVDLDEFVKLVKGTWFKKGTHHEEDISGASQNCWQRSVWAAILLQLPRRTVAATLNSVLGTGNYRQDIETMEKLAARIRHGGLRAVLKNSAFSNQVEAAMKQLSYGILIAGLPDNLSPSERWRAVDAIDASTRKSIDGNTDQMAVLAHAFGVDLVVLSSHADTKWQGRSIETICPDGSSLNAVPGQMLDPNAVAEANNARLQNAHTLHDAVGRRPIIIQGGSVTGGHFHLYRPL